MGKRYKAILKSTGDEYEIVDGQMGILLHEPLALTVKVPEKCLSDWEIEEVDDGNQGSV